MLRMLKYFKNDITKMMCSGMKDATEMMTFWSNGQRGKGLSVSSIERYFDGKSGVYGCSIRCTVELSRYTHACLTTKKGTHALPEACSSLCVSRSCSHLHMCIVLFCIMPPAEARCLLRDLLRGCDWEDAKFVPGMPSHYNPFTPALREQFVREWRTLNDVKKKRQHGSHGHCVPIQSWVLIMTVGLAEAVSLVRGTC